MSVSAALEKALWVFRMGFEYVGGEVYKRFFGLMPLHYPLRSQGENGTIDVVCPGTQLENTHFKENEMETAKITRNAQKSFGVSFAL